jgi:hypothetical protein
MSTELGVIAAAACLGFALVGWLIAGWIERSERRPRPLWLVVPVAGILGVAGYGLVEATGEDVAVGAVAAGVGIVIAVGLLLVWERFHPVVRGTAGVYGLTGLPCSALDGMSDDTARDLLGRWSTLSSGGLIRVAIVPADPELASAAGRAAAWLHSLQAEDPAPPSPNGSERAALPPPRTEPDRTQWRSRWARPVPAPPPAATQVAEPVSERRLVVLTTDSDPAQLEQGDLIVLLARDGTRRSRLTEAAGRLEEASRRADWVLLIRSEDALRGHAAVKPANGAHP